MGQVLSCCKPLLAPAGVGHFHPRRIRPQMGSNRGDGPWVGSWGQDDSLDLGYQKNPSQPLSIYAWH